MPRRNNPPTTQEHQIEAVYIQLHDSPVARTAEVGADSNIFVDIDESGRIVGIECLLPNEVDVQGPMTLRISKQGLEISENAK